MSLFQYSGTLEDICSVKDSGERRTFERFDMEVPARVDVIDEKQNRRRFYCQSSNISAGGIFLNTQEPVPENADVEIEIILFFEDPPEAAGAGKRIHIMVSGKVLRSERSGLIVRFKEDFDVAVADPRTGELIRVVQGVDDD